jgi:hypothetical protein
MKRGVWYIVLAIFLSSVSTGAVAVVIALNAQSESERKLCGIVVAQDDAYSQTTPSTETGRRLADALGKLRRDLHCGA